MKKPERKYFHRGQIERKGWCVGYSEQGENGEVYYPWSTKKECYAEAKRDGFKAVFLMDETVSRLVSMG